MASGFARRLLGRGEEEAPPPPEEPAENSAGKDKVLQQLYRYEALVELIGDLGQQKTVKDLIDLCRRRWKYVADVGPWRMVVLGEKDHLLVEVARGRVDTEVIPQLFLWDLHHLSNGQRKVAGLSAEEWDVPVPEILHGANVERIHVVPIRSGQLPVGVLSVTTKEGRYSEIDEKFIPLLADLIVRRLQELREAELAMSDDRLLDPDTELLSRSAILDQSGRLAVLAGRTGLPMAVLVARIPASESESQAHYWPQVASQMRSAGRDQDMFGRLGEHEFMLVSFPCSAEAMEATVGRIRAGFAALERESGRSVVITALCSENGTTPSTDLVASAMSGTEESPDGTAAKSSV